MQRAAGMRGTGGRDGLYALWIAVVAIGWGSVGTAWAADPATPAELAWGKQLFVSVQPACAVCHTLQAVGAQGEVGPVLDEIKPNADRVLRALRNGIGAMPSFAEKMTEQDMQAVARFVAQSTGAAP